MNTFFYIVEAVSSLNFKNAYVRSQTSVLVCATFIICVIFMLILTLVIASITLVERKTLALVQRRVGPNQTAFRGRLQYIADALKLLNKTIFVIRGVNRFSFVILPAFALVSAYLFWINALWGPNLSIAHIEYSLPLMGILSFLFSLSVVLISIFSKNKYCILAAVRSALLVATLELVWGVIVLVLISHLESFSFSFLTYTQRHDILLLLVCAPGAPFILLVFLLEVSRIPFDLVEAESELIAGYSNELSGFFFALFYLGEYFHLYFSSLFFAVIFFGF